MTAEVAEQPTATPLGGVLVRPGIPLLVGLCLLGDLLIVSAHAFNLFVIGAVYRPLFFFDMAYEVNLPTWYSSVKLALLALLFGVLAAAHIRARSPGARALLLPTAMAGYLSLDELAMVHDRFRPFLVTEILPTTGSWMVLFAPAFVILVAAVGWVTRSFWRPRRARHALFAAIALYVFSAAVLEVPSNLLEFNSGPYRALVFAEELGELLAVSIAVWGVLELLRVHGVRLLLPAAPSRAQAER